MISAESHVLCIVPAMSDSLLLLHRQIDRLLKFLFVMQDCRWLTEDT
jgi:uncharacterized membrane protein SirB2